MGLGAPVGTHDDPEFRAQVRNEGRPRSHAKPLGLRRDHSDKSAASQGHFSNALQFDLARRFEQKARPLVQIHLRHTLAQIVGADVQRFARTRTGPSPLGLVGTGQSADRRTLRSLPKQRHRRKDQDPEYQDCRDRIEISHDASGAAVACAAGDRPDQVRFGKLPRHLAGTPDHSRDQQAIDVIVPHPRIFTDRLPKTLHLLRLNLIVQQTLDQLVHLRERNCIHAGRLPSASVLRMHRSSTPLIRPRR